MRCQDHLLDCFWEHVTPLYGEDWALVRLTATNLQEPTLGQLCAHLVNEIILDGSTTYLWTWSCLRWGAVLSSCSRSLDCHVTRFRQEINLRVLDASVESC